MNSYLYQCLPDENEMFDGIKLSYNYDIEYFYLCRENNLKFNRYSVMYFLIKSTWNFSFVAIIIFVLSFAFFKPYPVALYSNHVLKLLR